MKTTTLPDGELQKLLVRMYMELWEKCNDPYYILHENGFYCTDPIADYSSITYQYSYTISIKKSIEVTIYIYGTSEGPYKCNGWWYLRLSDENNRFFEDRLPRYDELYNQHLWMQDDHPHFASPKVVDLKTVQTFSDFCLWAEDNGIDDNDVMEEAIRKEGFLL